MLNTSSKTREHIFEGITYLLQNPDLQGSSPLLEFHPLKLLLLGSHVFFFLILSKGTRIV